ncbi:MAG: MBL fold metallo-hydrolase [Hyphomonadaceae bacterium]|nr:MBL fold metallo-hydrolase [Hyphomonadaceae bacterium]
MRSLILSGLWFGVSALACAHPVDPTQTTYLGNEGIMVSDGHTKVLFDPLFPNGFGTYQMVPEEMRDQLMAGNAPYDAVTAIFISHMHPDHFSVDEIILYLETHAETRLFAPLQAVEWMRDETENDAIFERVTAVPLERLEAPLSYTLGEIEIDVVRIPHAGWPGRADVSNLVWRVTLADGVTVMHLGDADPNDAHFEPHQDHWQAMRTHTAYPPYWFFTSGDGPQILAERLNASRATGIHVPIQLPPDLFVTGADFFHRPGETRVLNQEPSE